MTTAMATTAETHVIFGIGQVGITLAEELLARGKQVRLVNRRGVGAAPDGATLIAGDAADLAAVQALSAGAAVIYNCTHAPYEQWPEVLPRLQENMIEGAAATGAKLVVVDTLYLYGETHGAPMTEETPHTATSRKGRLRAELAWGYMQAYRVGKARVAIGRAADFFGPRVRNSALGEYVFPAALVGKPALIFGEGNFPHSYSYIRDVARGLATLGEREEALGREWLLPVVPAITTREVLGRIGAIVGQEVQPMAVRTIAEGASLGIFDPVFVHEYGELFYQYTEPQIVDSGAITHAFGLHATPLDEALRATVEWYRAEGKGA